MQDNSRICIRYAKEVPLAAYDNAVRNAAPQDENWLTLWLNEARRAAADHMEKEKSDEDENRKESDPLEYPPSLYDEGLERV